MSRLMVLGVGVFAVVVAVLLVTGLFCALISMASSRLQAWDRDEPKGEL